MFICFLHAFKNLGIFLHETAFMWYFFNRVFQNSAKNSYEDWMSRKLQQNKKKTLLVTFKSKVSEFPRPMIFNQKLINFFNKNPQKQIEKMLSKEFIKTKPFHHYEISSCLLYFNLTLIYPFSVYVWTLNSLMTYENLCRAKFISQIIFSAHTQLLSVIIGFIKKVRSA